MSDLPISFSGSMVCALLREIQHPGFGKTQTRRTLNPPPSSAHALAFSALSGQTAIFRNDAHGVRQDVRLRYQPGDRLYVREHWRTSGSLDSTAPRDLPRSAAVLCIADGNMPTWAGKHRQAMHMPRWASRITLIVTDVRVERLQDCSEVDAIAEGIDPYAGIDPNCHGWRNYLDDDGRHWFGDPRDSYATLWDSINDDPKRPGRAWRDNPWVVAYSFRPILGNIDQIEAAA